MRWNEGRQSDNIEDRRGFPVSRHVAIGGGLGTVALIVIALFLGVDPSVLLQSGPQVDVTSPSMTRQAPPVEDPLRDFVALVLGDTEDTWGDLFQRAGRAYERPKLVLFSEAIDSACGFAQSAVGPFYCQTDHKVYLDLSFFRVMRERLGASGDFAQAYVIAHEVGHHVQNLLGIEEKVRAMRQRSSERGANTLSVRLELQADCLAGVWAYHANRARHVLEAGDIEEGLNAAAAIGDDRLQKQSRGYVVPDSFTHGSSAQRVRWFKKGLANGEMKQCDTFGTERL